MKSDKDIKLLLNKKALLLLSGGIDSAACIPFLKKLGAEINCVYINYGNISSAMEINSAQKISEYYNLPFSEIKIHIEKIYRDGEIMGRNAAFAFIALLSQYPDVDVITMAIHNGTPYYDSSILFAKRMCIFMEEYTNHKVSFFAPFIKWNKLDIYKYATENNVPINLTYSCENGTNPPCRICGSCLAIERIENAFKKQDC